MRASCLSAAVSLLIAGHSYAQQVPEVVEVVGQTPLGAGVDADRVASNVQSATAEELRDQRALDLADFMKRNLASVFVNEAQNNPLQPDVQYRGFVGSPLLGLPQGIAVYQDGVRINEPFGDTVNWALIPDSAIETVYLMPGSDPLFGLNALGGAIAIETKTGFSSPGTRAEVHGGSFGRLGLQAETGGSSDDRFSYFLTGSYLEEDGWRDYSPTEATQFFGNLGWQLDTTSVNLNVTLADTNLIGNGAAPVELLEMDRGAIFTRPDQTENELTLFNLIVEHEVSSSLTLTGNVYMRRSDISTYNGDDSDFEECDFHVGFICEEAEGDEDDEHEHGDDDHADNDDHDDHDDEEEQVLLDANGNPIPAIDAVEGATVNRTNTQQDGMGFGLQATWTGEFGGRENVFVLGIAHDDSDIDFAASTELGELDATRLAIPSGYFVGESFTRINADTSTTGVYLSHNFLVSETVAVTLSGRYNNTSVVLRDLLGTALNGNHGFNRFNPAVGVTANLRDGMTFYASYSESNRTPSPVELTCADEDDPCRLPNAFLADPPLEQVVAKTIEGGLRGEWSGGDWHAGVFRTTNDDDILFISAGALTSEGFFDNVGRTRRDGIEVNVNSQFGERTTWFLNYTLLDATFLETLAFPSPNNPAAIDAEVMVAPGDRLPLVPRHLFKGGFQAAIGERMTVGGGIVVGGDFHMRGDEGNDIGRIGEYAVLNLRGDYRVSNNVRLFLNVDNVLDEEYETFGLFGEPDEVLGDDFADSRFLSPSAPRAAWLGVEVTF